jgi:hypothetical protein
VISEMWAIIVSTDNGKISPLPNGYWMR